jgi:hypothetical protein
MTLSEVYFIKMNMRFTATKAVTIKYISRFVFILEPTVSKIKQINTAFPVPDVLEKQHQVNKERDKDSHGARKGGQYPVRSALPANSIKQIL